MAPAASRRPQPPRTRLRLRTYLYGESFTFLSGKVSGRETVTIGHYCPDVVATREILPTGPCILVADVTFASAGEAGTAVSTTGGGTPYTHRQYGMGVRLHTQAVRDGGLPLGTRAVRHGGYPLGTRAVRHGGTRWEVPR